jgi:hypothetical protein
MTWQRVPLCLWLAKPGPLVGSAVHMTVRSPTPQMKSFLGCIAGDVFVVIRRLGCFGGISGFISEWKIWCMANGLQISEYKLRLATWCGETEKEGDLPAAYPVGRSRCEDTYTRAARLASNGLVRADLEYAGQATEEFDGLRYCVPQQMVSFSTGVKFRCSAWSSWIAARPAISGLV